MYSKKKALYKIFVTLHILNTYNNLIINITDILGNTIFWVSSGTAGFKGAQKTTYFAIQTIINIIVKKLLEYNITTLEIKLKGLGLGKELIIRTLKSFGFYILSIEDKNTLAYNGCRKPKKRKI